MKNKAEILAELLAMCKVHHQVIPDDDVYETETGVQVYRKDDLDEFQHSVITSQPDTCLCGTFFNESASLGECSPETLLYYATYRAACEGLSLSHVADRVLKDLKR